MKLNEIADPKEKLPVLESKAEYEAGEIATTQNYTHGSLWLENRRINSLKGCPKRVTGDLIVYHNKLTSLEGCPEKILGSLKASNNRLVSLKGCPEMLDFLVVHNNKLSSFEYFPKRIMRSCDISNNRFTSFKDIDKHIKHIGESLICKKMNITSGYSDLFGIEGLTAIELDNKNSEIEYIVNKYLSAKDLIEFQDEMIKAGFESYL